MSRNLLLISSSSTYGTGYLDHCEDEIKSFLSGVVRVAFIPYALHDLDKYAALVRERFSRMEFDVQSIHEHTNPKEALQNAEACFIGGGNTFRLLAALYHFDLLEVIRRKVGSGMPYIGTSAGINVACVNIKTTNDMPIVFPPSFDALNLVSFNINPHYIDHSELPTHQGETRDQRISEFLEENDSIVVGLREGAILRITDNKVVLKGLAGIKIFRRDSEPKEYSPECDLDFLTSSAS